MSHRGSILIVDDEPAIGAMLSDHLGSQGYKVEVALNGGDAVMIASLERPDAVILDLMLPEVSGEEVFNRLQTLDSSIAVVLLTGMADETIARSLLRAGAFDYLRKPPDLGRLGAAVELAVVAGREKSRPGAVIPIISDRHLQSATPEVVDRTDVQQRTFRLY